MVADPKPILRAAEQYRRAAIVLEGEPNRSSTDENLFVPNMVLYALACELYLKSLYAIERKRKPPSIHELDKLFSLLSEEAKTRIQVEWENPGLMKMEARRLLGIESIGFDESLTNVSNAFVMWRYHYEFDSSQIKDGDGLQIAECTRTYNFERYAGEFEDVRLPLPGKWLPTRFHDRIHQVVVPNVGKKPET